MTTTESTVEKAMPLLPCPFCSSSESVKLHRDIIGDPESDECLIHWSVQCSACEVGTHWDDVKERCIKRWNARAQSAAVDALVDGLRHALQTKHDVKTCACVPCEDTRAALAEIEELKGATS